MKPPSRIFLYGGEDALHLSVQEIAEFLLEKIPGLEVEIKNDVLSSINNEMELKRTASELASIRVKDLLKVKRDPEPLYGEVSYEERVLRKKGKYSPGILYDGTGLMMIFNRLLQEWETMNDSTHIIFTNRLFGTFDRNDMRYHARVVLCGFPSIISTSGIVEAPAKPKEFYKQKHMFHQAGIEPPIEELKKQFKGQFIDYEDDRMTEVLKGYVLQALFHHMGLEPFCDDPACRFYNAHWQMEVLRAQLEEPEFCAHHQKVLEGFG